MGGLNKIISNIVDIVIDKVFLFHQLKLIGNNIDIPYHSPIGSDINVTHKINFKLN